MIQILSLITIFFVALFFYIRKQRDSKFRSDVPGLKPQLLIGNLWQLGILKGESLTNVCIKLREKYGDIFQYWNGPNCFFVFNKLEHAMHVLRSKNMTKYERTEGEMSAFRPFQPHGLEALRGHQHQCVKRILNPLVQKSNMAQHTDAILQRIDEWILVLRQQGFQSTPSLHTDLVDRVSILAFQLNSTHFCANYNLQIIGDNEEDVQRANRILAAMADVAEHAALIVRYSIPDSIGNVLFNLNSKCRRAVHVMKPLVEDMIDYLVCLQRDSHDDMSDNKPQTALLDAANVAVDQSSTTKANVEEKISSLSREVLRDWILSVFGGAYDSSSAYAWFIFYMSKYPQVQAGIKRELNERNITRITPLTSDLIYSLSYVDCVLKEILRHAPIVETVQRQVIENDVIDGIPLSVGDRIMLSTRSIHRSKNIWRHPAGPDAFVPERFLEHDKNYPPQALMTFGGGLRRCYGSNLAQFHVKLFIVRTMQTLSFHDAPGNSGGSHHNTSGFPKGVNVYITFDDADNQS
ncbi:unnamed protein product [Rotaria socialis]|uniref:unspecific monooxygenase n=2 Tax=Rotaria socialis TaxID=392032 RepID=A0A820TM18_9BILA|nr:unnamed protein product [Rotaria socialis]CAF3388537.1 unnamed protein product [Rotaria socialis]CAF3500279.1 unnamed protein product [Rotaria socialis]CAF3629704.1 unnamed protein product [Rotaria socialis]CAF4402901.1 unnamed protein product [Rotaria socialis]